MPEPEYRLYPIGRETFIYDEGDGRQLTLVCHSPGDPPQLCVPSANSWGVEVPSWAVERRRIICDRLRAAGCVLIERWGDGRSAIVSPDGTFRIETRYEQDERGATYRAVSLIVSGSNRPLVDLPGFALAGPIEFLSPGVVVLGLEQDGPVVRVLIDVPNRVFEMHSAEQTPLDKLAERLRLTAPLRVPQLRTRAGDRIGISNVFWLCTSFVFVAGGFWMAFTADSLKDRCVGGLSVLFFGACGVAMAFDFRQWVRGRWQ